jgi:hypothetical protein
VVGSSGVRTSLPHRRTTNGRLAHGLPKKAKKKKKKKTMIKEHLVLAAVNESHVELAILVKGVGHGGAGITAANNNHTLL